MMQESIQRQWRINVGAVSKRRASYVGNDFKEIKVVTRPVL
jgi:hypothetical protein